MPMLRRSFGTMLMVTGLAAAAGSAAAQDAAPYKLSTRISVIGDFGWDYLIPDAAAHRLYVAHGMKIDVIDMQTNAAIGTVDSVVGAHGATAAFGQIFATAGRTGEIVVADEKTFVVKTRLKATGGNPDAILFEPVSGRIFSFNGTGKNATAVDAKSATVVGTIALGGKPEFAAADGRGHVYVNIEDTSELVEFDARTLVETHRISIKPCDDPTGLAFDSKRKRIFSACSNKLMTVVDAEKFVLLQTVAIGAGTDGAAVDIATGTAFSSNGGDGTISMLVPSGKEYVAGGTVPSALRARTMAIDPSTRRLYTATAEFGPAPAPTETEPRPRPPVVPGTFAVFVFEPTRRDSFVGGVDA